MSKGQPAPPPVDYEGLAREQRSAAAEQVRNNRPNVVTPFSNQSWSQDGNGNWTQSTQLTGGVKAAVDDAIGDVSKMGSLDLTPYMNVGSGDSARNQAIDSSWGEALKRLNPQFRMDQDDTRTRLLNQGLTPGSEAYEREVNRLGQQQGDQRNTALATAIARGTEAGDSVFRNNLGANQFKAGLATQQYNSPMARLQGLSGFLAPMGFQADNSTLAGASGAAGTMLNGQQQAFGQWQATKPASFGDIAGSALGAAAGIGGMFLSDARAKENIRREDVEAYPGVPFATFRYRQGMGPAGVYRGVIAQDLERVAPRFVQRREDGLMEVDYSFLEVNHG